MNRATWALTICLGSTVAAGVMVYLYGHPARALFGLYPVWLFTAEWLGERLPFVLHAIGHAHVTHVPPLSSRLARDMWGAAIVLGIAGCAAGVLL